VIRWPSSAVAPGLEGAGLVRGGRNQVPDVPALLVSDSHSLAKWIAHVFDHPVTDPQWHWSLDAPNWVDGNEHVATLIADTFERSGDLLAPFSDEQLNQGLWFLISNACSNHMLSLTDSEISLEIRLRALRSFVPLFEQVMPARCSQHLSHLDERGASPLNSACYMWWDIIAIPRCRPSGNPKCIKFDAEVLGVLGRLLAIPHDACRESALHGIGHWSIEFPRVADIIDEFLARAPDLRPELVS
jgi:hypothetical protein